MLLQFHIGSDFCNPGMNAVFGCYKTRRYTANVLLRDQPGGVRRNQIAIRNASQTSVAFIRELMLQPTTFLENKSITIASYSQPSCVQMYLIALTST